jgi:hypothetical protein
MEVEYDDIKMGYASHEARRRQHQAPGFPAFCKNNLSGRDPYIRNLQVDAQCGRCHMLLSGGASSGGEYTWVDHDEVHLMNPR